TRLRAQESGISVGKPGESLQIEPRLIAKPGQIGGTFSTFEYSEPSVKDTGTLLGVSGAYNEYTPGHGWQSVAELDFLAARHTYDGQLQDGTPFTNAGGDRLFNGKLRVGPVIGQSARTMWVPYVGFGYRYLQNRDDGDHAYGRGITYL